MIHCSFQQLADWAEENDIRLPHVPEYCQHPGHLFYLLMPSRQQRDQLLRHLYDNSIGAVSHYLPLHCSDMGRRLAPYSYCPVTESVSGRLLRLPIFVELSVGQQPDVIDTLQRFY